MSFPVFVPGLELSEAFFHEIVEPLLREGFPGLVYSAGLVGSGSEVLGFDTARSADHHWGPRVMLFVEPEIDARKTEIDAFLGDRLPPLFRGWSTHWGPPDEIGVRLLVPAVPGQPIAHRVEVMNWDAYINGYLGFDPSSQKLRSIRDGRLFRDQLGVQDKRDQWVWYSEPVWREKLAAVWHAIGEEEPFIGRCVEVGDERGSRLVAARLVELALHLAFLQEREYAPYSKWFGTAFQRLAAAPVLGPLADAVLTATEGRQRERAFNEMLQFLAKKHITLNLTPAMPETVTPFWGRPFLVIHGDRFAVALRISLTKG